MIARVMGNAYNVYMYKQREYKHFMCAPTGETGKAKAPMSGARVLARNLMGIS